MPNSPSVYVDGAYVKKHPSWHLEDLSWKARQVVKTLARNSILQKTIRDVGCRAGEVTRCLSLALPDASCHGLETSTDAFRLTWGCETKSLSCRLCDVRQTTENFDLILLIDLIEHVEDCFGFLRSLRRRTKHLVAHIPLDLSDGRR